MQQTSVVQAAAMSDDYAIAAAPEHAKAITTISFRFDEMTSRGERRGLRPQGPKGGHQAVVRSPRPHLHSLNTRCRPIFFTDLLRRQAPELLPASTRAVRHAGGEASVPHGTIAALKYPAVLSWRVTVRRRAT